MMSSRTDTQISADVLSELAWDPAVSVTDLDVHTSNGYVTLTGMTATYAGKDAASTAAYRVHGVRGVANDIVVDPSQFGMRSDADVESDARAALSLDTTVPIDRVNVSVERGVVTLTGDLDYYYQRAAAVADVTDISGVQDVVDLITVTPQNTLAEDVADNIASAFARNAELADDNVTVQVDGSKVVLDGTVRTWSEYEEAEAAAWRAPGVNDVENRILVSA